jgi:hypothetical protein
MSSSSENPEFKIVREDLLAEMKLSEIEERETVLDPMGAAPHLPFGHLNPAWKKFLEDVQPSDVFWSFSAKFTPWRWTELRQGYVVVRGEEIGPYFIAVRIYLDEGGKTPPKNKADESFSGILAFLRKYTD